MPVETESTFKVGVPKELFRGLYFSSTGDMWDLSPDGRRFLMMKQLGTAAAGGGPRKINIVVNWFEELKQRVPTK